MAVNYIINKTISIKQGRRPWYERDFVFYKPVNYTVYDIIGREVITGEFSGNAIIDISTFQNGSYIIRFGSESEMVYKKLVVEK